MSESDGGRRDPVRAAKGVGSPAPERLGKIEKYILVWALRRKHAARHFHSRSRALEAYHRHSHGLTYDDSEDLRSGIPLREYRSLQVRFTNALRRLDAKGYVEIHRSRAPWVIELPDGGLVDGPREGHRGLPFERVAGRWQPVLGRKRVRLCMLENRGNYLVNFRLTQRGRAMARAIGAG